MGTKVIESFTSQIHHFKLHTRSAFSCPEEAFWDPQGISGLSTTDCSHALPKSSNLLTDSFDIERTRGDTILREVDLPLSSLEGCSPSEGALAILEIVMPSLAITASINLYIAVIFWSKVFTFVIISSILASFVRLTRGDTRNLHSY